MQDAARRIERARLKLVKNHRFYGYNLSLLKIRERPKGMDAHPDFQTFCTDDIHIFYNPEFVAQKSVNQIATILAHEILHVLGRHGKRAKKMSDPELAALAMDYAVNGLLLESKFEAVPGWAYEPQFHGKSFEQIYKELEGRVEWAEKTFKHIEEQKNANDNGNNSDSGQGNGNDDVQNDTKDDNDGNSSGGDQPGSMGSGAGSGNDENPVDIETEIKQKARDYVLKRADTSFGKVVESAVKETDNQRERELSRRISRASNIARIFKSEPGDVPGGIERLVGETRAVNIPWYALLQQEIEDMAKNDYNFMRPSRRYMHTGFCLPSLQNQQMGTLGIFVDTSASIDKKDLDTFCYHINAIMRNLQPERLIVIYCDAEVPENGVQEFYRGEVELELKPEGGGGTDFKPPFEYIEKHRIDLKCAIYFTDLECSSFPEKPSYPVYWIRYGCSFYASTPPFGKTIGFESDEN